MYLDFYCISISYTAATSIIEQEVLVNGANFYYVNGSRHRPLAHATLMFFQFHFANVDTQHMHACEFHEKEKTEWIISENISPPFHSPFSLASENLKGTIFSLFWNDLIYGYLKQLMIKVKIRKTRTSLEDS